MHRTPAATAALGLALGIAAVPATAHAAPVTALTADRATSCPVPGQEPGIGQVPRFTDANVALYAGGDYTADGGTAEAEGLLVVGGDATFAKASGGVFNVGRVGAGSGILPESGALMLAVGGDLGIASGTTVDVGHGLTTGPRYGGSVQVGGKIDEKGRLETNGGSRSSGTGARAALAPYDSFGTLVRDESARLGALPATGTAVRSGGTVTFTAGGGTGTQVFDLPAADLDGASTFLFKKIPAGASVLVNVVGGGTVSVDPMAVGFNDDRVDVYSSPKFGEAASRILYNFKGTKSLRLGGGGNFMGSILAPEASADLTASTNGRVYVGGDLRTHGSGNETHNYPWNGSPSFTCVPKPPKPGTPTATPAPPQPTTPAGTTPPPGEATTPPTPAPTTPEDGGATPPAPGATEPAPSSSQSTTPGAPAPAPGDEDGSLATTGAQFGPYLGGAAALAALGGGFLVLSRRRRQRH
ncbi:choice-of-anchor A family protein [Streptomyces termitum]|uniref:choice-of-anchor A family protein n=1 Tax=Streptomyces termitum TaxID=67368 RepID=UPI0037B830AB